MSMESELSGYDKVGFEKRLPIPPRGEHDVTLISFKWHESQQGAGNGIMVTVKIDNRPDLGPVAYRINLGGKWPIYGKRESKAAACAILGYAQSDPRCFDLDREGTVLKMVRTFQGDPEASPYYGRKFRLVVSDSGRPDEKRPGQNHNDYAPRALVEGEAPARGADAAPAATTQTTSTPAATTASASPAASTTPATAAGDGGPWFDFKAPDPRAGKRQYNKAGAQRDKPAT